MLKTATIRRVTKVHESQEDMEGDLLRIMQATKL